MYSADVFTPMVYETHTYTHLSSHFSHVSLFVAPGTVACQAPLSKGILQARILEWVAMPSSRGSSQPRDRTCISCGSCISGGFLPLTHQESSPPTHTSEVSLECNYNKYPKCRKIWVYYSTCICARKFSSQRKFILQLYRIKFIGCCCCCCCC